MPVSGLHTGLPSVQPKRSVTKYPCRSTESAGLRHIRHQTIGLRTAEPVQLCVGNFNPSAASCFFAWAEACFKAFAILSAVVARFTRRVVLGLPISFRPTILHPRHPIKYRLTLGVINQIRHKVPMPLKLKALPCGHFGQ